MTGPARAFAVGLLIATGATSAQAQTALPAPEDNRVSLSFVIGRSWDAREGTPQGPNHHGVASEQGGILRYQRQLGDRFALAAMGGFFFWADTAAAQVGYVPLRIDLGVAPVWKLARGRFWNLDNELYVALPVGVSVPIVVPPARRAVAERIENRPGWFAGCTLGAAFIRQSWGLFVEMGYERSATGIRSVVTPNDGSAPVARRIDYVDHQQLFAVGLLARF